MLKTIDPFFVLMDRPKSIVAATGFCLLVLCAAVSRGQSVNIALSNVEDTGNAPDPTTGDGEVDYDYAIGTYDVTVAQYCAFLNAVATTPNSVDTTADPYGCYNSSMDNSSANEGIVQVQGGISGDYTYSVVGDSCNDPITYVTWLDAARFCNWLQNGEPTTGVENCSTTEMGAYTLDGDTTNGLEPRNPGATYFIPTLNEWYKAAFYNPTLNSGSGGYYLYATQYNCAPGNTVGNQPNQANYYTGAGYSVTQEPDYDSTVNYLTPVGAFTASTSYYGTYDQSGDVFNWTETNINGYPGLMGDAWDYNALDSSYAASGYNYSQAYQSYGDLGFRITAVQAVPETPPLSIFLTGASCLLLMRRKLRPSAFPRRGSLTGGGRNPADPP